MIPDKLFRCTRKLTENDMVNFEGKYLGAEFDPENGQADDDFALSLARWFKYEFFSWVNKPKCENWGKGGGGENQR